MTLPVSAGSRREIVVGRPGADGGAGGAGAEVDALEGVPGDQHPAVAPVVEVDAAVAAAHFRVRREHDLATVEERHQGAVGRAPGDGADGVEPQADLALGAAAVELVGADALLPVPLDVAGEVALPRAHRAMQPHGHGGQRGGGEKVDGADPQTVEVDDAPPGVPDAHAVVEIAGLEAVEVEDGAALERHLDVAAACLEARDVAEARHEEPAEADLALPLGELETEELDRVALPGQALGRHVGGPGVLGLEAVEVVAPERLLAGSPAQPPFVGGAVDGGDPAVEEPLIRLWRPVHHVHPVHPVWSRWRRRGWGGERGRGRRGGFDLARAGLVAHNDEEDGEDGEGGGKRPADEVGSGHGRLSRKQTTLLPRCGLPLPHAPQPERTPDPKDLTFASGRSTGSLPARLQQVRSRAIIGVAGESRLAAPSRHRAAPLRQGSVRAHRGMGWKSTATFFGSFSRASSRS